MKERPGENFRDEVDKEGMPEQPRVFYLLSDLHMLSRDKEDAVWQKLETEVSRGREKNSGAHQHTIIMGDLPLSDYETHIVAEFKDAKGDRSKLTFENEAEERTFNEAVAKRGWRAGTYRATKINTPEKMERAKRSALDALDALAEKLKKFPNPILYSGNAEANSPYGGIPETFERKGIPYFSEPTFLDAGTESAIIIWPSVKDPKTLTEEELQIFKMFMEEKVTDLLNRSKHKKYIFIAAHEQPFFGSKQFKKRTEGTKTYGTPFHGVNPTRKFLFTFLANLSSEQRVGIAYGHLHDPEETIRKGTGLNFAKSKSGGAKWSVRAKNTTGEMAVKDFDLYYISQGSVGVLTLDKSGFTFKLH